MPCKAGWWGGGFTGIRAPRGGAVPSVGLIPVKPTTPWDFTWHKNWRSSFLKNHVRATRYVLGGCSPGIMG